MKNQQSEKNSDKTFDQIRCKRATKLRFMETMAKIKKPEGVKFTPDQLLNFLLDSLTDSQIKEIQDKNISPAAEEKRLKALWAKSHNKKVSDCEWKQMLYSGALSSFIQENSRIY